MRTFFCLVLVASAAHADFKRLHAERATATSFLESNWNKYQENYHPTYVLDDDPSTAWVEGAEGDGVGQSLTVKVSALKKANALKLVITPGYQKSKALFAANGTPTQLGLEVRSNAGDVTTKTELTLQPKWGTQTFQVPLTGALSSITFTILAVRPGKAYRDTCLSDLQLFVDSDVPYDKRVEEAKREAMLAWKKERLSTARYFAALPPSYPFASTAYSVKQGEAQVLTRRYSKVWADEGEEPRHGTRDPKFVELDAAIDSGAIPGGFDEPVTADLKALRALVKDSKGGKWFSASAKVTPRLPEGFESAYYEPFPELLTGFLRASDVTLFEAAKNELVKAPLKARNDPHGPVPRSSSISTVRLLEGTPAAPRRAFLVHLETFFERSDFENTSFVLLSWGEDGLLRRATIWREMFETSGGGRMLEEGVPEKDWPPEVRRRDLLSASVWEFTVTDSKIGSIRQRTLSSFIGDPDGPGGLSPDEGISSVLATFEPKPKK